MIDYTQGNTRKKTSQQEAIPGREKDMARNNAGGVTFVIDKWMKLNRFLILGTEGGTYYVNQKDLTKQNVDNLIDCIKEDGDRVLKTVIDVSVNNRAPKNDQAIFVMAMLMTHGTKEVRKHTGISLTQVCRIGTHLFMFAHYINALRGWGSIIRKSVASWYNSKEIDQLQYQLVKYQGRQIEGSGNKWTHKDVLRLAHVKPISADHDNLFKYVVKGYDEELSKYDMIGAVEELKGSALNNLSYSIDLIDKYGLPQETWPTELKNVADVWEAAIPKMPITALIRNLGKLSSLGILGNLSKNTKAIISKIGNEEILRKARVHPMQILTALLTYQTGHGVKGKLNWDVTSVIVDALDAAFYTSFGNVEKTGKNYLLALDVSGSMSFPVAGSQVLSCRQASAAMALITANVEDNYEIIGFTDGGSGKVFNTDNNNRRWRSGGVTVLDISPKMRLNDVIQYINKLHFNGTDCSLPMLYAKDKKLDVDAFVVYTDNETWAGKIQPVQALNQYRNAFNPNAVSAVMGMTSTGFSIADPNDKGMMDFVGFDTSTPQMLSEFVKGNI